MAAAQPSAAPMLRKSAATALAAARAAAANLPPEVGGIALNLFGLSGFCDALGRLHEPLHDPLLSLRWVPLVVSVVLLVGAFVKLALVPPVVARELWDPKACASHGGLLMALTGAAAQLDRLGGPAKPLVCAATALQLSMVAWYLVHCAHIRSPPVPYWFPPTVGCGVQRRALPPPLPITHPPHPGAARRHVGDCGRRGRPA